MQRVIPASIGMGLGVVSVSMAAKLVESRQDPPNFGFDKGACRFDQSSFNGRWFQLISNFDPSTILSSDAQVREAQKFIEDAKKNGGSDDKKLWGAQKLVSSALHPDTDEIVPPPFRMAGYVPFNGPICIAMMAATTTPALLFWNWANQSQNALVNYFNRNASSVMTNEMLLKSYAGAVSAALIVAFGVSTFIKRSFSPATAQNLLKFVAFPSSCVASCGNAYVMRKGEIDSGISVEDGNGKELGLSKKAAEFAVRDTVISRAILQVPVFFVTPLVTSMPPFTALAASSPGLGVAISAFLTTVSFGIGLPAAVAYFPSRASVRLGELEGELQKQSGLSADATVFYNKGL
uniref:Sidoreflexin n=1 Tax=Chromera velia CCMP2878 TaxID=1169474 RepID=A0A0G4H6P6_9ALVE|mmetsp:Transcript_35761/g.70447  ORF Transcript_35761/g.70447 Transcript_35761/m.70447 type:complete len:349 (-) Transcript_35761:47-1093(-)|eukprot:Cvel_24899.t1-p1 / transcript=Cvel_24899.t1 / gene=Cvel_24899 / organism=Chromera_velia_CCMP2878 / gene_product=Sideroflexin-5, putative / transcript_product=Sideroflexin-5, putative / location=Cvel_scaffold2752:6495-8201(+) / protein_length=348 / sequence_SO=supercontig / SO=protein_coding / is_pseudo=false